MPDLHAKSEKTKTRQTLDIDTRHEIETRDNIKNRLGLNHDHSEQEEKVLKSIVRAQAEAAALSGAPGDLLVTRAQAEAAALSGAPRELHVAR